MPEVEILQIPGNFNFIDMDKQHIQKKNLIEFQSSLSFQIMMQSFHGWSNPASLRRNKVQWAWDFSC